MVHRQKRNTGKVIGLIAVLVLGFIAYDYISTSRVSAVTGTLGETETNGSAEEEAGLNADLIKVVDTIEAIELDGSIFDDTAFKSLESFAVTVTSQPVGKANPFAPASGQAAAAPKSGR